MTTDQALKRALLVPLALDVAANVLLCAAGALFTLDPSMLIGSWRQTLSARAGHMAQEGKPWGVCARVIDAVFGAGHCAEQLRREWIHGGVWAAWRAS